MSGWDQQYDIASVEEDMAQRLFPAPMPYEIRVWPDPDGNGFNYHSLDDWPVGDAHWTAHLTNALHDAGWQVLQDRKAKRARAASNDR